MAVEVLTINNGAVRLKLAVKTVCAMPPDGEIVVDKTRGQQLIKRTELEQLIDAQPRGRDGG